MKIRHELPTDVPTETAQGRTPVTDWGRAHHRGSSGRGDRRGEEGTSERVELVLVAVGHLPGNRH